MKRRAFTTGLAAAGLFPAAPARAKIRGDGRDGFPSFGYVWLNDIRKDTRDGMREAKDGTGYAAGGLRDLTIGIQSRIIVVSDRFTHEIGVDHNFPMENEKRSSILNPTLQRQFRDRVQIGDIRLGRRTIWIDAQVPVKPTEIRLTDFEISFRINGDKLARRYDGPIPQFGRLPKIGLLFRRRSDQTLSQNLMAYIAPHILHYAG